MIDNSYSTAQTQRTGNTESYFRSGRNKGNTGRPDRQQPTIGNNLQQMILALLQQLLAQLQQGPGKPTQPEPQPKTLELNQTQQDNLKNLLGFTSGAPVSVEVRDEDGNGQLSAGDTAIANGGITGGVITEKTLTAEDVDAINQTAAVPQTFTDNLQKWQQASAGADSISYTTQQTCFCPLEFTRPMNITEQNGQITSATYTDTGEDVPANIVDSLQTVDQRFAQLQQAYESNAERIDASYDPELGYPTSVFIDRSFMIADEEILYNISNLSIN
ncbi:MAG: DUF6174 domain-containing protein [Thiolinea sp.]